jgi:peptidoglycan/LPS O-acetylase OafA/YrhL
VASGVLTGDPSWFTLPIGGALLGEAGLVRRALRARGESPAQPTVALLEGSAMALMALPPLVETVSRHVGFGALAAAIGVVLATWGALTEVRRRLAGGLATVAAALALLLGVPLARLVPQAGAPVLWLAMVVVGLVAVVAAAGLEQGRARVRRLVRRAGRLTDGWE